MKIPEWMNDVTLDDLDGDVRTIAELFGINVTLELMHQLGGVSIYVPMPRYALRSAMKRYIKRALEEGRTRKQIARDLDISIAMYDKLRREI